MKASDIQAMTQQFFQRLPSTVSAFPVDPHFAFPVKIWPKFRQKSEELPTQCRVKVTRLVSDVVRMESPCLRIETFPSRSRYTLHEFGSGKAQLWIGRQYWRLYRRKIFRQSRRNVEASLDRWENRLPDMKVQIESVWKQKQK